MTTFKDLDDTLELDVPDDLEHQARSRIDKRNKRNKAITATALSLLIVSLLSAVILSNVTNKEESTANTSKEKVVATTTPTSTTTATVVVQTSKPYTNETIVDTTLNATPPSTVVSPSPDDPSSIPQDCLKTNSPGLYNLLRWVWNLDRWIQVCE